MRDPSVKSAEATRIETLEKKLARAQKKVGVLESMIEDKTRSLFLANEDREQMTRFLERILETMTSALLVVDESGRVTRINQELKRLTGLELTGEETLEVVDILPDLSTENEIVPSLVEFDGETNLRTKAGESLPVLFKGAPLYGEDGRLIGAVCLAADVREKRQLELELRHAQKLESVGQLAAGVAHEVNTPIQFAGDSVYFLQEAFSDLQSIVVVAAKMRDEASSHDALAGRCAEFDSARQEADLDFVAEEVPAAITRALDGIERVSTIVSAMKAFAHPGNCEKAPQDLNAALQTTLEVCRNEYKYVAEVEQELGDIPQVKCNLGDINQVLLNLIVNAAHAIRDRVEGTSDRGAIRIATRVCESEVEVEIQDDGGGIPAGVRERIFDPFFTTKDVGVGTGQGLAISRRLIVDGHGGSIRFETEEGVGTSFFVRIPIESAP